MLNLRVYETKLIAERRDLIGYRDMSREQLEVLFSNKRGPETVYLDNLLKNRVSRVLNMKELLLRILELENKAAKDKPSKEYHQNFNKLAESEKTWGKIRI